MKNTYASYLGLQRLLSAQTLQTSSDDELLFIIIHQQHELWFKLMIHELDRAIASLIKDGAQEGDCIIAFKRLSRVSQIQHVLIASWDIMATLTPDESQPVKPISRKSARRSLTSSSTSRAGR